MKVFIFSQNNQVYIGSTILEDIEGVAELSVPSGVKYFVIDSDLLPSAPQESWLLSDDGAITINQDKLLQFQREQMPNLTKRGFRTVLRNAGIFEQAESYVKNSGDGYLQDAWDYSDFFSRLDPFIEQARTALGLSEEQVDQIWTS